MRAIIIKKFGGPDVLDMIQLDKPKLQSGQLLVAVKACSATTADYRIRSGHFPTGFGFIGRLIFGFLFSRYRILGTEVAGTVVEASPEISNFKTGDQVIVHLGGKMGGYQEFILVNSRENGQDTPIFHAPSKITLEEAATVSFGATTAFDYLHEKFKLQRGHRILIFGASGSVGTAAIQLAKKAGAYIVAVSRKENTQLLVSLGADAVMDYRETSFETFGKFDVVMDCAGVINWRTGLDRLVPNGTLLLVSGSLPDMLIGLLLKFVSQKRIVCGPTMNANKTLPKILELIENGEFKAVIDRVFQINDIRDAHRYLDQRHRQGNIVLKF